MLSLKSIVKNYQQSSKTSVSALKGISLNFRDREFVSILGPSGCGKTTLLNIIGGLDRYTSGDLIINGRSTKNYADRDWDTYRNNSIGFVFQSYNLVPHISVVENVELALKISGVSSKIRRQKAVDALTKVGLADQLKKKPNQLSGGQMQRVAIARALVNDPEIILADEPTGALDSVTSVMVLKLLKEVAKDKLVIMVTHNEQLADEYSDRIIRLLDGEIIGDTNDYPESEMIAPQPKLKRTKMSYLTALSLSGKNLIAKRWRTLLISFAGSIGIIGVALVLAISNGLNTYIANTQQTTMTSLPITIDQTAISFSANTFTTMNSTGSTDSDQLTSYDRTAQMTHTNIITQEFVDYMKKIDPTLASDITYKSAVNIHLLNQSGDTYTMVNSNRGSVNQMPENLDNFMSSYDIISGSSVQNDQQAYLMVDSSNRVSTETLTALGINLSDGESMNLSDVLGRVYKVVSNDAYYQAAGNLYMPKQASAYPEMYTAAQSEVTIVGVVRVKADFQNSVQTSSGLYVTSGFVQGAMDSASGSAVAKAQLAAGKTYSVVNGTAFTILAQGSGSTVDSVYQSTLMQLGATSLPDSISITPKDFASKTAILDYVNAYNTGRAEVDQIKATDLSSIFTSVMTKLVDTVSIVLVAFSAISLIVSSIMIGIITYVSVIERTKEIGVLRSLGARKKDITRVFNAETIIIGLTAGVLGVVISYLICIPINSIVLSQMQVANIALLDPRAALILIGVSILLTLVAGFVPAKLAAKKDPVVALRTE